MTKLDPRSADLETLINAAREIPPVPRELSRAFEARLAAAITAAPITPLTTTANAPSTTPAAGAVSGAVTTKIVIAALAGLAVGGAGGAWITLRSVEPVIVRVEVPTAPSSVDAVMPEQTPNDAAITLPSPIAHADAGVSRRAPDDVVSLEEERTLIDAARAALSRGEPRAALDVLDRHRARYPRGALTEEREGLRVMTLARVDPEQAQRAAERFAARYPESLLLPAIARALERTQSPNE